MSTVIVAAGARGEADSVAVEDVRRVARAGGVILLASAFGSGLSYAFGMYLARRLGPSSFGLYSLGLALFQALSLIAVLGLDTGVVKFVSEQIQLGRRSLVARTILQAVAVTGLGGLAAGLFVVVLAGPLSLSLYREPELVPVLRFFGAALPFAAVGSVLFAALQALHRFGPLVAIRYGWEPSGKFVLAGAFLGLGWGLSGVLSAVGLTLAVSVAASAFAVAGAIERSQDHAVPHGGELRKLWAFCLPLTAATAFNALAPRADVFLLGFWKGATDVGIYSAAFQTAAILALVLSAFETVFAPVIGRALVRANRSGLAHTFQSVSRLTWLVTVPIAVCVMTFSADILALFGPAYVTGAIPLIVLTVGHVIYGAAGTANVVLLMGGHSRLALINTIALGIGLMVAAALLVPRWGLLGGAVAAGGTLILTVVVRTIQVWGRYHIHPFSWGLVKQAVAGAAMAVALAATKPLLEPIYDPVLAVAAGCLYLGLLGLLGLDPHDKAALRSLLKGEASVWN
ncbi:MAG: flippase [Nitrospirota bacterium]